MKLRNKKAEIDEAMTLTVATFIIIFLLVIFILISSLVTADVFKKAKGESIKVSAKESSLVSLSAYLQTPVNIRIDNIDKEIKISDLIRLSKVNSSYKSLLESKTEEIFDSVYGKNYAVWSAGIFSIDKGYSKSYVITEKITIPENVEVYLQIKK